MATKKALALYEGRLKETQPGDEIEATARLADLEAKFRKLLRAFVLTAGQPVPQGLESEFITSLGE